MSTTQLSPELIQKVADAIEAVSIGFNFSLIRLVDGIHTYRVQIDGITREFSDDDAVGSEYTASDRAYAFIGEVKNRKQAELIIGALRDGFVEEIATWIEAQRKDIPAHGWEFAAPIRKEFGSGAKLVWIDITPGRADMKAETPLGEYVISVDSYAAGGRVYLWLPGDCADGETEYASVAEAKEAAQKDWAKHRSMA